MQKISLFGHGLTTKSLAKKIQNTVFYDDNCTKSFIDENGFEVKPSSEFDPKHSDLEIPSPGIAPVNPLIKKAKNLISEYDYFKNTKPLKIWISGTNGKTTTTQMTQHLLSDKNSQAGGNIGMPLSELNPHANIWILETSSFTIHYTNEATPDIYVLLPITPDHISWHESKEKYIKTKLKPLKTMKEGSVAIIPKAYENIQTQAYTIIYENEKDIADFFNIDTNKIKFEGAFLMDALLAISTDKILFDRINYDKINSFELDPHRQEELRDKKNRLWVNDTKATNTDACIVAVNRYKNSKIHLILGGDDKGIDLNGLFDFLKNKNIQIYAIGSNKEKLCTLSEKYNIDFNLCKNLKDAIKQIDKNLLQDEVALLSPSASSLDEYNSYAQRGDEFKKTIQNIS